MDNIVQLDIIRVERHKPRKCTCTVRKFTVDTVNREITCGCGLTVDPFEAMKYIAEYYERINEQHKALHEQRKEWLKQKPHSVLFRNLEKHYTYGKMLPFCPNCDQLIDLTQLTRWGNAEFYRKRQELLRRRTPNP